MILKSISEGLKFAFSLNVILPYLILFLISSYVLIGLFSNIVNLMTTGMGGFRFLLSLGIFLPFLIIIGLIYLWVNGAITDQAKYYPKRKPLVKSFQYLSSRYLTILCTLILYGIITAIASYPPYIGPLLSFIISLMLFFLYPAIIVDKKGCIDSFKKSFNTFMRYPLETFVTWLLIMILSVIIVGIFALPLIVFIFSKIIPIMGFNYLNESVQQNMIQNLLPGIYNAVYSPYFIVYLFILCIGLAINEAFQIGTRTRLYLNTRKIEV